nr:hypothetical protein [Phenylobacterium sp.]
MTPDKSNYRMPPPARRRGASPHVLFAGVAGACLLGAGLGLWARPAVNERQMAVAAPGDVVKAIEAAAPLRRIQIVVDDGPAPIGTPIEVLSAVSAQPAPVAQPAPPRELELELEPQAPVSPPEGLMRVRSVTPPGPEPAPPKPAPTAAPAKAKAAPAAPLVTPQAVFAKAKPVAPPKPQKVALARAAQARTEAAKAAKAQAQAQRIELARMAKAEKLEQLRLAKAKAEKLEQLRLAKARAEKLEQVRLAEAKAEKLEQLRLANAKAEKLEQLRLARAKAEKRDQLRLAKAEAKGRAEARAEAKAAALAQAQEEARLRIRLASLARAAPRAAPHAAKPATTVEMARLERRPGRRARQEVQVEQAAARKPPRVVVPSYRARPAQVAPQPHPGLMRVSTSPHCANRDPGVAMVCTDPALGAAERQLARAYQGARAAGVPDAQLQRQQQHWLASRSAAAREAPWAVHDVYLARIAELNGMAKDAHGDTH